MLSTYDAIRSLHLLEAAIKDKDAEKQKQWLKDNEFNYGKVIFSVSPVLQPSFCNLVDRVIRNGRTWLGIKMC